MSSTCREHIYNSSKKPVCMAFKPDRNSVLVKEEKLSLNLKAKGFFSYLYSAPHPLTKLILMVHILVSW